jgi:hypothetical protein
MVKSLPDLLLQENRNKDETAAQYNRCLLPIGKFLVLVDLLFRRSTGNKGL